MCQAVGDDPFRERVRKPIVEALFHVGCFNGIGNADGMIAPEPWLRRARKVLAGKLSLELRSEIVGQIVAHEFRTVGLVTVKSMSFAETVMNRRIEWACRNEGAE